MTDDPTPRRTSSNADSNPVDSAPTDGEPTLEPTSKHLIERKRTRRSHAGLLTTTALAFGLQTLGALLNFAMQSGLAKVLGAVLFGEYSYAFNLAQLIASPTDLGATSSVTRLIPQYRAQHEAAKLRGVMRAAQLTPIVVGSLAAGITAAFVTFITTGSSPLALLLIAISSIPAFALSTVQANALRALGSIVLAFGPLLVLQPLLVLIGVLIVPDAGVLTFAWYTVASLLIVTGIQSWCLRAKTENLATVSPAYPMGEWFKISIPLLVINTVQLAFQRLDIVSVGLLLDARSAGVYAIANRLAVAAGSLQKALVTVVAPRISGLHWSGRPAEVESLVLRGVRLVIGPATVVTIVLVVEGGPILGLISDHYRQGYAAMVVYAVGQLVSVAAGPVGWLAATIGEQRAMARITIYSALIAIVLYAGLIPTIGIVGAAAGNSIGITYRNVAANRLVRRHGFRITVLRAIRYKPEFKQNET